MATFLLNLTARVDLPTVQILLQGWAFVTEMDLHGRTALSHAAENGTVSVLSSAMLFPHFNFFIFLFLTAFAITNPGDTLQIYLFCYLSVPKVCWPHCSGS
jgi:hypothetical protein